MVKTTSEKCKAIHLKLLNEGKYVSKLKIEQAIETVAGSDKRTLNKYWRLLTKENVIEVEPCMDKFKVNDLDTDIIPDDEDPEWIKFRIPTEIKEAIKSYGIDTTSLMTSTVLDQLSEYKRYTNEYLETNYSESEIKYMWSLMNFNLEEADESKNNLRLQLFKETGNSIDSEKDMRKALVDLRKKALDLKYEISGKTIPGGNDD